MNSVGSQFARAVKAWLRDTAPLSFTHRALFCLFGHTVLTFTHRRDRQIWGGGEGEGGGTFRIPFCSIEDRFFIYLIFFLGGGRRGEVHLEYSPSLTESRTSSTAIYCLSKVWKIRPAIPDLHKEARVFLHTSVMHVS